MALRMRNNDSVTMTIARWLLGSNGRMSTRSMTAAPSADSTIAMRTATAPGMSKALAMA